MIWKDLDIKLDFINAKIKWLGRNIGRSMEHGAWSKERQREKEKKRKREKEKKRTKVYKSCKKNFEPKFCSYEISNREPRTENREPRTTSLPPSI
jgi:hypothetical protein